MAKGIKYDEGKPRYELLPPEALEEVVAVFTYGAKKYHDFNYREGLAWSRIFGAAMRHLWTWWRGEELDKETNKHHLAHAACCVLMLLDLVLMNSKADDRRKNESTTEKEHPISTTRNT
jgi:hypothetical protein